MNIDSVGFRRIPSGSVGFRGDSVGFRRLGNLFSYLSLRGGLRDRPLAFATFLGKKRGKSIFKNTMFLKLRLAKNAFTDFSNLLRVRHLWSQKILINLGGSFQTTPSRSRHFWAKNAANTFLKIRFFWYWGWLQKFYSVFLRVRFL